MVDECCYSRTIHRDCNTAISHKRKLGQPTWAENTRIRQNSCVHWTSSSSQQMVRNSIRKNRRLATENISTEAIPTTTLQMDVWLPGSKKEVLLEKVSSRKHYRDSYKKLLQTRKIKMGKSIIKRVICVRLFDARYIILAFNNPHIPTMVVSVDAIISNYGHKCVESYILLKT